MRNINRRESPRIEIKLRCHVTSPALWMRSAMYTENISRSGLLVAWRGEGSALPHAVARPDRHGRSRAAGQSRFRPEVHSLPGTVIADFARIRECPRVALRVNYMDFRAFHDRMRADRSHAAGRQYLDGLKKLTMEAQAFPIRAEAAAVVHGLRVPDADRFSIRPHGRRQDAARAIATPAGTFAPANGFWPTAGFRRSDIFSFSKPGEPWFAWEWLSRRAVRLAERAWADCRPWCCSRSCCCRVTFTLLYLLVRRKSNPIVAICGHDAGRGGFVDSLAGAAAPVHAVVPGAVLRRAGAGAGRRTRLAGVPIPGDLPVVTVLWTNLHGGFFVGILMICAYGGGEFCTSILAGRRRAAAGAGRRRAATS